MDNKDFLDQFSNNTKPESFKEEERIPVQKERKPLNIKYLLLGLAGLLLLLILLYFLFWAPKIVVPDFVGQTNSDVEAWVKQQQIERTGINIKPVYDFDSEQGTILTQSIPEGKKVRKNAKIDFTVSLGADPDEKIKVPDLSTMDKTEIQDWINENKLAKTRIISAYHESVPENEVIDFVFTGTDEDNFTRGSTLRINVSKGPAPAGEVVVEDFEKKLFESLEAWAKSKKIVIEKRETYSDTVQEGYVISQSIPGGRNMKEGETLSVVVSKGKAIFMPNMVGWTKKQVDAWLRKNTSVYIDMEKGLYSSKAKDVVLSQSLPTGSLIDPADMIELTISLGDIVDVPGTFIGQEYHDRDGLHDWKDAQNELGANITINRIKDFSDDYAAGIIIRYDNSVEVGGVLNAYVSRGRNILLQNPSDLPYTWEDLAKCKLTEEEARTLCDLQQVTYEISYSYKQGIENGRMISIRRWDDRPIRAGTYLPEDITVYIVICDDSFKN